MALLVAAPAMALALPLLEVGLSIVRRFLRNEPIFSGDRGHIHHRLMARGFTPRRVALLLYAACGIGATLSLLQSVMRNRLAGLVLVLFGVATWIGVHYLEYAEFEATRRFLWSEIRPILSAHIQLKSLERALLAATTVEQCWDALEHTARALGYSHMNARLAGEGFATEPGRSKNGAFWQMRLNLSESDYLNIAQREGDCGQPVLVVPFIDTVRRVLPDRLAQLGSTEASLAKLAGAVEWSSRQAGSRISSTRTVISSDCAAPSVNAATAS